MPSYHSWGPNGQHSRLPPTPPDYQPPFLTPMSAVSEQGFYSSQNFQPRRSLSTRDYTERYSQAPPAYNIAQSSLSGQVSRLGHGHLSQDYSYPQAFSQNAPYQYGAVGAPMLPPIRVTEAMDFTTQFPQQAEPKPKEEKPTGGVAQHLDYDMDLMSSFVAEMSQKLVTPEIVPTPQFRKYVSQILSSTRLPSSTIMLGLFYLASRMKQLSERGQSTSSSGTVYRMLTTSLLLGSKFLDDNTFQNRSWAEVSSIPVHELNMMELQWLTDFNWEIHGMMYDEDEGFFMWIEHWHAYEDKAQLAKVKEMQKLAPIETNLHRSHSVHHQPLMSPEGPIPPQYQQGSQYDTRWVRSYISEYSPPSAPHSGPATPDYYTPSWAYAPTGSAFGRHSFHSANVSAYSAPRNQLPAYSHNYNYPSGLNPNAWMTHGPNCGCSLHTNKQDYYFSHTGYPMQTVVG